MPLIYEIIVTVLLFHKCAAFVNDTYYLWYHLAPCKGWMNDPNGFIKAYGIYHLFYQYNPLSSQTNEVAHWGHATSKDLFHWKHEPIALYPDENYDVGGVFSGSSIFEDNKMFLFYTGNVNHPNENPDKEQRQAIAVSQDGITFEKYANNPIINGDEYQPNLRDPKVWKHLEHYYMILGNSINDTIGRAILYKSPDKINWKQVSIIGESDGSLGYMWECPDLFKLNDSYILMFSPQGMEAESDNYRNLYQTGYMTGTFDYESLLFTPITEFRELDHGHDFYATQTINEDGRRILVALFDMWEQDYPERNTGFTGCMVIPRELALGPNGIILQNPVREIATAIGRKLFSGKAKPGTVVVLNDKTAQIVIRAPRLHNFEIFIVSDSQTVSLSYDFKMGYVTLDRGGVDGIRRTKWRPRSKQLYWRIFVDASTVEVFCGDGEVTFSSRFFPEGSVKVILGDNVIIDEFEVNAMKRTMQMPNTCCINC